MYVDTLLEHSTVLLCCCDPFSLKLCNKNEQLTLPYIPSTHKSITQLSNSFAQWAPQLWHDLPLKVRTSANLDIFCSKLKTHYFSWTYPNPP